MLPLSKNASALRKPVVPAAVENAAAERVSDVVVLRARPGGARSDALSVRVGDDAWAQLNNPGLQLDWRELERACPWATPFQSRHFVLTWFRHYRARFAPVAITLRGPGGALTGLLVLAASLQGRELVVAGAHQAEYQAWLALPECQAQFIVQALEALDAALPGRDLTFKYLPRGLPVAQLAHLGGFSARCGLVVHRRPLLRLVEAEVQESLRKKSNKSRWARLQRLGPVAFRRVTDPQEFADLFDDIIASYDARQCAMKGVLPFAQDPCKKPFHLDLMRGDPDSVHVTVTTLSGRVVAAHIGVIGTNEVHLSILCHSDMHASQSPGKLHLLRLGELMLKEGRSVLDLTPGGDEWKERFANAHDEVYALTVFRTPAAKRFRLLQLEAWNLLKRTVRAVGISPAAARRTLVDLKRRWVPARQPAA